MLHLKVIKDKSDENVSELLSKSGALIQLRIREGQLREFSKDFDMALPIYIGQLVEIERIIVQVNTFIGKETERRKSALEKRKARELESGTKEPLSESEKAEMKIFNINYWLEIKHRLEFLIAAAYNSLKTPDKEEEYYSRAEVTRKIILNNFVEAVDVSQEALALVHRACVSDINERKGVLIEEDEFEHGIKTASIFEAMDTIKDILNEQWNEIDQWRNELLLKLFLDVNENSNDVDATGEEYAKGAESQELIEMIQGAYDLALNDRKNILRGTHPHMQTTLLDTTKKLTKTLELSRRRFFLPAEITCLAVQISKLRNVASFANTEAGELARAILEDETMLANTPASEKKERKELMRAIERKLVSAQAYSNEHQLSVLAITHFSELLHKQSEIVAQLEKERDMFTKVFNAKVVYYKHLQSISDKVVELDLGDDDFDDALDRVNREKSEKELTITRLASKRRYLDHLLAEEKARETDTEVVSNLGRECVTCFETIVNGVMTACGHIYCNNCNAKWLMVHKKCAICKNVVTIKDVTRVSFRDQPKPVGDTAQEGRPLGPNYTPLPQCIADIPLVGSFGTKIDAIVRHMLYILSKDSTEKIILYSNESTAVKICMLAMEQNGIGFTAISGARKKVDGVKAFKESARISVLILQAKSQAAGLTLTVATHVFILEPQLNISVELQAINRVHRIGQAKDTFVHRYIIKDTIEMNIFERRSQLLKGPSESLFTREELSMFVMDTDCIE